MLNEIWAVMSLLVQIENGQPIGTATGFFYLSPNCGTEKVTSQLTIFTAKTSRKS